MFKEEDIIEYYNRTEIHYKLNWNLKDCLAMHYGYADEHHKSFKKSLINMNQVLMEKAKLKQGDKGLDAGCGVGGTSIYFAKNSGAHMTGISITESQIVLAKENAKNFAIEDLTYFDVQNYLSTSFEDHSFDAIVAVESTCHAPNISDFTKEAYRLLKPGGRLIVADYYKKENLNDKENHILMTWLNGWTIDDIPTVNDMKQALSSFSTIEVEDGSSKIMPSSKYMYNRYYLGYIPHKIYDLLYTVSKESDGNFIGAKYQYLGLKNKIWSYQIFTTVK